MGDAFRPCPRGHGVLVWTRCCLHCLPFLLGNCLGHQPLEDIPRHNASHASTGFSEGGHPLHSEDIGDRKWNVGKRQLFCHRKQEVGIFHIVQDGRMCSSAVPEGPAAALRLAERTLDANLVSLKSNCTSGTKSKTSHGIGSRGSGGLRCGSWSASRV